MSVQNSDYRDCPTKVLEFARAHTGYNDCICFCTDQNQYVVIIGKYSNGTFTDCTTYTITNTNYNNYIVSSTAGDNTPVIKNEMYVYSTSSVGKGLELISNKISSGYTSTALLAVIACILVCKVLFGGVLYWLRKE